MEVADKTVVSLRYLMKNSRGEVLEDIMNGAPVEYVHGAGNILPALEVSLEGLRPGEKKLVSISNETTIELDDKFYFDVIIDQVRFATDDELKKRKTSSKQ